MTVVAILQARTSSSRLPQKVLLPILGKPMLAQQIERIQRSRLINKIIVATSDEVADDPIEKLSTDLNVNCFRGSLNDVLDRFYSAALVAKPTHIVRLTGDCPLIDPEIIDRIISHHLQSGADYTSNIMPPTFPDGLDVEVMKFTSLAIAWDKARLRSEREHVTPYIRDPKNKFIIENVSNSNDLSFYRWTVDEQEDFELITKIYEELYQDNPCFKLEQILKLFDEKPHLNNINSIFERNEGYLKSLKNDALEK